jgi:adenylate kinase family enzyme
MAEIIVVHGPPYSGKSTQSKKLTEYSIGGRSIHHVSSGNLLRAIRTGEIESAFGHIVNGHKDAGRVDDRVVNGIMFEFISKCPEDSIVLVDGYPRFKDAVGLFIDEVNNSGHTLLGCINVDISLDTSLARFPERGTRKGERFVEVNDEVVRKRYSEHEDYTQEAIAELGKKTRIISIDGNQPVDAVWESFNGAFIQLVGSN